ncbi:MAG: TauD/TfdA family dioxygenase [Pseudomonadota bacterium]|nr:TauD/TfdA family dioxygenase [Pseudomonadota bacterium]
MQEMTLKPVSGALGATIGGVDLARDLNNNQLVSGVHKALLEHCVIFFHDQRISPEQHIAFGRQFGTLNVHGYVKAMEGYPEIIVVAKAENDKSNFGGDWHSDVTYLDEPAMGSILYAKETPEYGGDTMFANMYLAYDTLSQGMKRMLDGMRAVHTARDIYGLRGNATINYTSNNRSMTMLPSESANREALHPVVRTHPETGRKCLYVNRAFTVRFEDMTETESRPLLQFLWEHCARPEFTCRFRWQPNSIAFWDNRAVQHYALNDYLGQRRIMHRVTINGDRPR